jgi:DNA-binding transcriptional MerR regulator
MKVIAIDVDTKERVYTRKEVADLVGVSTQTIRLWEDAGLIPPSVRDDNGYRYWKDAGLEKIKAFADLPAKDRRKK